MAVLKNARHEASDHQNERRFYVYTLIDPRSGDVFYVGKGSGNRDKVHVADAHRWCTRNPAKTRRIQEIEASGQLVKIKRVAEDLTEAEAFRRERQEIAKYGIASLTNISRGQSTENDRLLLEVDGQLAILYQRLNDFLAGEPFNKQQWHMLFDFIRSLRRIRRAVAAESSS